MFKSIFTPIARMILRRPDHYGPIIQTQHPFEPASRWGYSRPSHAKLRSLLEAGRDTYKGLLDSFESISGSFCAIDARAAEADSEPRWVNPYFTGLDAMTLYGLVVTRHPTLYFEVGSGNSTKFVRRAIKDHGLRTRVVSLDPNPRVEVDGICDEVIRNPIEQVDLAVFERLNPGDILFIDNSHCCFTNNDVTVFFLDVLPNLPAGVIVQIHDIFFPDDYPPAFADRYYAEQYMLAAYLLANGPHVEMLMPVYYVSTDEELRPIAARLVESPDMPKIYDAPELKGWIKYGVSFWFVTK